MSTKTDDKAPERPLPAGLADVALLDIRDVLTAVRMSASWVHDEVRERRFPQPLRFGPRCTRWRSADIRAWLIERAEVGAADKQSADMVTARAKKASAAAQAKRIASVSASGQQGIDGERHDEPLR